MENHQPTASSTLSVLYHARTNIQQGNVDAAFRELVGLFPKMSSYPTYFIVLGECYLAIEEYGLAYQAFERALTLSPNSIRPLLLQEIARAKIAQTEKDPVVSNEPKELQLESSSQEHGSIDVDDSGTDDSSIDDPSREYSNNRTLAGLFDLEHQGEIDDQETTTASSTLSSDVLNQQPESSAQTNELDIAQLADILTRERPIVKPSEEPVQLLKSGSTPEDPSSVYSDTFAKILISQGKLAEAQKVYMHLARLHPERRTEYRENIIALERMLLEIEK
jgi:tetratricopeptide (TPR) repeat protein